MKKIKCPKCGSHNIQPFSTTRSRISISKAAVGGIIFGGAGLAAGLLGNKGHFEMYCVDCGKRFKTR